MTSTPLFDFHGRTLSLLGELTQADVDHCIDRLLRFQNDRRNHAKSVTLYVASSRGSIPQFLRLFDVMRVLQCPLQTVGLGFIQGIGALVLASGTKGRRCLLPHAVIDTCGIFDATEPAPGTAISLRNPSRLPHETSRGLLRQQLFHVLQSELGLASAFVESLQAGGEAYTASEAVGIGLVDELFPHQDH